MGFKDFPINRRHAITWQHHQARYVFALQYCYRREVLDAGSQMGFGAHLLSYVANKVTLADINQKALDMALKLNKFMCPVETIQANFEKEFPASTDGWDTIVAFEVIEHLCNPHPFLQNIKKSLKAGGYFVFSVPDMVVADDHKRLYDEKGIKMLIEQYFTIEKFYIQDHAPITDEKLYKDLRCFVGVCKA